MISYNVSRLGRYQTSGELLEERSIYCCVLRAQRTLAFSHPRYRRVRVTALRDLLLRALVPITEGLQFSLTTDHFSCKVKSRWELRDRRAYQSPHGLLFSSQLAAAGPSAQTPQSHWGTLFFPPRLSENPRADCAPPPCLCLFPVRHSPCPVSLALLFSSTPQHLHSFFSSLLPLFALSSCCSSDPGITLLHSTSPRRAHTNIVIVAQRVALSTFRTLASTYPHSTAASTVFPSSLSFPSTPVDSLKLLSPFGLVLSRGSCCCSPIVRPILVRCLFGGVGAA